MNKNTIIAFDLDDVLCKRPAYVNNLGKKKYEYCKPIKKNIKILNNLYNDGFKIVIFSSRGMTYYEANIKKIKKNLLKLTENQLKSWEVKYHTLVMGKIHYDLFIDDRAINSEKLNYKKILKKIKEL